MSSRNAFVVTRNVLTKTGPKVTRLYIRVGETIPVTSERRLVVSAARQAGRLADEMKFELECQAGFHGAGSQSSVGAYLLSRQPVVTS